MGMKVKTEGLPEVFQKEGIEKYELRIPHKGTEIVFGIDSENSKILVFCRGTHEKKYIINYKKPDGTVEEIEAEPFEGVVELTPSAFSSLYFVVMGIDERSKDVGSNPVVKMRASYDRETGIVHLVFTDYKRKKRTIVGIGYPRLIILQALFERMKNTLPLITSTHAEEDKFLTIEYDRVNNVLHLIGSEGNIQIKPRTLPILKMILQKIIMNGLTLDRPFTLPSLTVNQDGSIRLAGNFYGKKKIPYLMGGEERKVPAVSVKILQLIN